ncbi:MAG: 30S ribosomal protein S2 [Candidatus Shikimatogenerans bostrichidophilus]|nr:MAG: 30S ribosomal protein S2 [Candidatus Shikimatogenerans bostrichidophilus]
MIDKKKKIKNIFKNKIILGHKSSNRNPKMSKYILLKKNNIDIINPLKIIKYQKKAELALKQCAIIGGIILFVGTKKQISNIIKIYAKKVNMPYINYKWPAGLLTNIKITKLIIKKIKSIKLKKKKIYKFLSKKEKLVNERKYKKIKKKFKSILDMNRLPLFIIIVDVKKEYIAVQEAKKKLIYIIGIVDTDSSPDDIDYLIPANDDSYKSIKYILKNLTNAIIEGKNEKEKKKKIKKKKINE